MKLNKSYIIFSIILTLRLVSISAQSNSTEIKIDSSNITVINDTVYKIIQERFFNKELYWSKTDSTRLTYVKIVFSNILFKQSKTKILSESFPQLEQILVFLQDNPKLNIIIKGFSDKIGSSRSNLILSRARARVIKRYLKRGGVKSKRVTDIGFGDNYPVCNSPCKENRRVEFFLSKT